MKRKKEREKLIYMKIHTHTKQTDNKIKFKKKHSVKWHMNKLIINEK